MYVQARFVNFAAIYIYIYISCWKRKSCWKVTRQVRDHGKSETWYDDAESLLSLSAFRSSSIEVSRVVD